MGTLKDAAKPNELMDKQIVAAWIQNWQQRTPKSMVTMLTSTWIPGWHWGEGIHLPDWGYGGDGTAADGTVAQVE
jgi:hypothetical protein